jgi:aldose 1-epimerase
MRVERKPFGKLADGTAVELFTLTNPGGVKVDITNYGGIITSLWAPDKSGKLADIVLGYNNIDGYLKATPYFGAIVGRYANRIGLGRFSLDGTEYTLAVNNGKNALHGGLRGFDKVAWRAEPYNGKDRVGLELSYQSKDGEEGYPGTLDVVVRYTLTAQNELIVDYSATTDKATVLNLTQHSYFNLAGHDAGDILGHVLQINAKQITPVDDGLIPTGELKDVAGTPFDFNTPTAIGARIEANDAQLKLGGGYDHNFVLKKDDGPEPSPAARVVEPTSGRVLEVLTTEPGMQLYTGNFLDGKHVGKGGTPYLKRHGFCLETQHFPDSPNKPQFPSPVLRPGETFQSTTIFRFSVAR